MIELATLEDHTLEHRHYHKDAELPDDYQEPEEEYGEGDDADRALLSPGDRPSGRERSRSPSAGRQTSTWSKALRIVIEVRIKL